MKSDSEEECSYAAFVRGVYDIDANQTATSSPVPTAATAHVTHAEKKEENNEDPEPENITLQMTKDTEPETSPMNQGLNNTLAREETEVARGKLGSLVEETTSGTTLRLLERVGSILPDENHGGGDITREHLNNQLATAVARIVCKYYRNV